jgi:hypothetical protein
VICTLGLTYWLGRTYTFQGPPLHFRRFSCVCRYVQGAAATRYRSRRIGQRSPPSAEGYQGRGYEELFEGVFAHVRIYLRLVMKVTGLCIDCSRRHSTPLLPDLDKAGWISVLDLSTMWQMQALRDDAIRHLGTVVSEVDKLVLAEKYDIPPWILPALTTLVNRDEALSVDESREIGFERAIKIAALRERRLRALPEFVAAVTGSNSAVMYACDCGHDTEDIIVQKCLLCSAQGHVALWTLQRHCQCIPVAMCIRCGITGHSIKPGSIGGRLGEDQVSLEFALGS